MRTNLIINGVILLAVAVFLNFLRGFFGGILSLLIWIVVIVFVIFGIIRIIQGFIKTPRRRVVHHVHHYEKPRKKK